MSSSDIEPKVMTADEKEVRRREAHRVKMQEKYATDPEYRERVKAANRENSAKRRAAERERRQKAMEAGEPAPTKKPSGKPLGRPRRQPTDAPIPRSGKQPAPA
jgi:hypothetical protein